MEENTTTTENTELKVEPRDAIAEPSEQKGVPSEVRDEDAAQQAAVKVETTENTQEQMLKFQILGKDVEIPKKEMNTLLGLAIVQLNVNGKNYWDEFRKIFTVPEPMLSSINKVFE